MTPEQVKQLRQLPSVDRVLAWEPVQSLTEQFGHGLVVEGIRSVISAERAQIRTNNYQSTPTAIEAKLSQWLHELITPTLKPVINATGVIIHTNLGRAPLSQPALDAIQAIAQGYANLEYDIASGKRGSRSVHAAQLVTRLTGAKAATVVNNAASGVLLMLSALCAGREVIVSRGQLVEIGGGFRMPDVMRQAGVKLVEVGTTNRTHLRDFANAINENTAAILSVHQSNYKIVGFTTEPTLQDLAGLAHQHQLPFLYDQGSGTLLNVAQFGLEKQPLVQEAIAAGCDVVVFSGDKLLGGPQAGVLCGREALIATIKRHPLARAVRPDKLCYAALSATLHSYVTERALREIPVWQMLSRSLTDLSATANRWAQAVPNSDAVDGYSTIGGGTLPGQSLPTCLLRLQTDKPDVLAKRLREGEVAIIGRIQDNALLLDPRTVLPHQETQLIANIQQSR